VTLPGGARTSGGAAAAAAALSDVCEKDSGAVTGDVIVIASACTTSVEARVTVETRV